jgi:hypothetical protein
MNILLRDFNAKLTCEDIFKPTENDRLRANINGNAGGAAKLSIMFPNRKIHKNTCTSPDRKTHKECDRHRRP